MSQQKSQIAHLIELAKTDGALDPKEVMLIYGFAQKAGLTKDDMDEIIEGNFVADGVPESEEEKVSYFYQLLILAIVDGEGDDKEVALLLRMGDLLDLNQERVKDAIDYIVSNHHTDLSQSVVAEMLL